MRQVLFVVMVSVTLISCDIQGRFESFNEISSLKDWARKGIWLHYTIPFPILEKKKNAKTTQTR